MSDGTHFRWNGGDLLIQLRVSAKASRDQIGQVMGDRLKISITAPPVDGKANRHLLKFIAKRFELPASRVGLVSGATGRDKTIRVQQPDALPTEFRIGPAP